MHFNPEWKIWRTGFKSHFWRVGKLTKISKKPSWVLGYSIAFFVFALFLLLLSTFSSSFFPEESSKTKEEYPYVPRIRVKGPGHPPVFAYWICGSSGDGEKILRLLKALYHPRNRYLLQLDATSSPQEKRKLALSVKSHQVFGAFRNVDVVGSSNPLDHKGSSVLASTLHAAALFLKISRDWDWFIPLSASDYPIMTQDDLLHAFTSLPRDLNFIHYSNNNARNKATTINQVVVDPGLYAQKNAPILYASETRTKPNTFRTFQGSAWTILTRKFMEYCIHGWDNLPRTLLLYFTNAVNPLEFYFHTVLCNSPQFLNTSVNINLRYLIQNTPPKVEPHFFNLSHYKNLVESGTAFAGQFQENDLVLQKLDEDILKRPPDGLVRGKWCLTSATNQNAENNTSTLDYCRKQGNINVIKPGPSGLRLQQFLLKLVSVTRSKSSQCNRE
ncbi:Beta-glucuronosyltransferase glcat14a [Thalictrum thalictroides]|uniref:Beta-glucuronosyltransferase glcat14a n=1 Tax=Thalictrum thalictroides TaxID=46969 RepID=A0A7J6V3R5_THATH|nr:Beta-glucuronosyltransferase glcat14a [Thalictrum thalictroides]